MAGPHVKGSLVCPLKKELKEEISAPECSSVWGGFLNRGGLIWLKACPQEPAIHPCQGYKALLFPCQPGAPGGERQLGPLVRSQNPLSLGSVALPISACGRASLSSSVKPACGHPCPTSNLPTPRSGPPVGTQHFTPCLTVHPEQWVGTWPKLANQTLSWGTGNLRGTSAKQKEILASYTLWFLLPLLSSLGSICYYRFQVFLGNTTNIPHAA